MKERAVRLASVALWCGLIAAPGAGCYRVQILVEPAAGAITYPDGHTEDAPGEVRVSPFRRRRVTVTAVNHRPLQVPVRWRPFGWTQRTREVEVRLVEEHGPAGSAR